MGSDGSKDATRVCTYWMGEEISVAEIAVEDRAQRALRAATPHREMADIWEAGATFDAVSRRAMKRAEKAAAAREKRSPVAA